MEIIEIPTTEGDEEFVRHVSLLLSEGDGPFDIIAGELGAYDIPAVHSAVNSALDRGAPFSAYANVPRPDAVAEISRHGGRVSVGLLRSRHHYFVDGKGNTIVSLKHPAAWGTRLGTRRARLFRGDQTFASAVRSYKSFLETTSSGASPSEAIDSLIGSLREHPVMVRRIPLAQNILMLARLDEAASTDLLGVLEQGTEKSGQSNELEEPEDLTAHLNQLAIAAGFLQIKRDSPGSEWDFASPGPGIAAHPSDVSLARGLASTDRRSKKQ